MKLAGKKIFVGLSGGVDSAVTAALLQDAGAKVTGVFIKGWYPPGMPCTWASDRRDAMRVAASLHIPFHTLDASVEYKRGVIDYLLAEYRAGRTPNPDIMCNREVKFGAFYAFAMEQGADYIATGHYAQQSGGELLRGVDPGKDQSYFLWAISKEALAKSLFPLGAKHKEETRKLAQKYGLPVSAKKDSQGICFLGSISVEGFLNAEFQSSEGDALDVDGVTVGRHRGALLHTLGARISLTDAAPGPWYVIAKDIERNTLTVAHEALLPHPARDIALQSTNWLTETPQGTRLTAQYRYHGPQIAGVLSEDRTCFIPDHPITEPVASGQSLVIYHNDTCIGGGIIG